MAFEHWFTHFLPPERAGAGNPRRSQLRDIRLYQTLPDSGGESAGPISRRRKEGSRGYLVDSGRSYDTSSADK